MARDLDIGESTLRNWRQAIATGGAQAFPGRGNSPALEEELRRLRAEVKRLTMGRDILEKSDGLLRRGVVMRYDLVEAHRGRWPVRTMCRVLRVSPGGYHDRRGRPANAKAGRRAALVVAIKAIHGEVKARHGSPRIHAELAARGQACGVNTAARLMRGHGIVAKARRTSRGTTDSNHDRPVAANVVDRDSGPTAVKPTWTADVTPISTGEGWPYLAAVEDLDSRKIVGWSTGPRIDGRPVVDALEMALAARRPGTGLVAHPGRGGQSAGEHHQELLARREIVCGMSRRANCRDNAPMEGVFASLEKGLTHGETFATREQARTSLFESIEIFYNRVRRHSSPGYRSPIEYERAGSTVNPAPAIDGEVQSPLSPPRPQGGIEADPADEAAPGSPRGMVGGLVDYVH